MTTKPLSLTFTISGEVSQAFRSAIQSADKQLGQLRNSFKQLNTKSKKISKFTELKHSVKESETTFKTFQNEVKLLAQEIRQTDKPTKKLLQNFEMAKRKSARVKQAFIKKRESLHKLRIELQKAGVNTRKFATEQKGLIATINQLKIAEDKLSTSLRKRQTLQNKRNQARSDLVEGAALGYSFAAVLRPSIEFEAAMADVAKVVNFTSDTALKNFSQQIIKLSRTIPMASKELAGIAAEGGRLGLAEKDIFKFVQTTAKMATSFDILPEEAAQSIAKLSNIFSIPIPNIQKLGDAINQLGNNTAATEKGIISVLTRVGGTAKQFGLSATETAALADAFLALGKPPEIAATAINALLLKLQTAKTQSNSFKQTITQLGFNLNQLAGKWESMIILPGDKPSDLGRCSYDTLSPKPSRDVRL